MDATNKIGSERPAGTAAEHERHKPAEDGMAPAPVVPFRRSKAVSLWRPDDDPGPQAA